MNFQDFFKSKSNKNPKNDGFFDYIKNMRYFKLVMKDKQVSFLVKVEIVVLLLFLAIYTVSPIDLVPDIIPILGFVEDGLVGFAMLSFVGSIIQKELLKTRPKETFTTKTGKSKIIDVKFEDTNSKNEQPKDKNE